MEESPPVFARDDDDNRHGDVTNDAPDDETSVLGIRTPDYTLKVFSPKTKTRDGRKYTSYGIYLQTASTAFRLGRSRTWRRFSEFLWLRKELDRADNWRSPPSLPARRFWNILDPQFVESRRHRLEQWLHEVLSEPLYLSSTALHLFLQTELSLESIQDYLAGRIPEDRMEEIWTNQGKLYTYQPHNLLHNSFRQEPVEIHHSLEVHSTHASPDAKPLLHYVPPPHSPLPQSATPSLSAIHTSDVKPRNASLPLSSTPSLSQTSAVKFHSPYPRSSSTPSLSLSQTSAVKSNNLKLAISANPSLSPSKISAVKSYTPHPVVPTVLPTSQESNNSVPRIEDGDWDSGCGQKEHVISKSVADVTTQNRHSDVIRDNCDNAVLNGNSDNDNDSVNKENTNSGMSKLSVGDVPSQEDNSTSISKTNDSELNPQDGTFNPKDTSTFPTEAKEGQEQSHQNETSNLKDTSTFTVEAKEGSKRNKTFSPEDVSQFTSNSKEGPEQIPHNKTSNTSDMPPFTSTSKEGPKQIHYSETFNSNAKSTFISKDKEESKQNPCNKILSPGETSARESSSSTTPQAEQTPDPSPCNGSFHQDDADSSELSSLGPGLLICSQDPGSQDRYRQQRDSSLSSPSPPSSSSSLSSPVMATQPAAERIQMTSVEMHYQQSK